MTATCTLEPTRRPIQSFQSRLARQHDPNPVRKRPANVWSTTQLRFAIDNRGIKSPFGLAQSDLTPRGSSWVNGACRSHGITKLNRESETDDKRENETQFKTARGGWPTTSKLATPTFGSGSPGCHQPACVFPNISSSATGAMVPTMAHRQGHFTNNLTGISHQRDCCGDTRPRDLLLLLVERISGMDTRCCCRQPHHLLRLCRAHRLLREVRRPTRRPCGRHRCRRPDSLYSMPHGHILQHYPNRS